MEVPGQLTRAAGDVHALGNPHFMIDPIIAKTVAQHIANTFATVDAAHAADYQANEKKFEATINAKLRNGGQTAALSRPEPRRLSRFVALFRAPFWIQDRHFPGTETGHPALAFPSRR